MTFLFTFKMRHRFMTSNALRYAVSTVYTTIYKPNKPHILSYQAYTHRVYSDSLFSLEDKFSEKDKKKILAHFNQFTEKDIEIKFAIDNFLANSIIEHQKISGKFKTLSDTLKVRGMKIDNLYVICEKILTADRGGSTFFPKLKDEELSNIKLIVAFDIDIGGVGWTLLDKNLNVLEWSNLQLLGTQQFSHYGFKKKLEEMKECIPVADLYLLEKTGVRISKQYMNRALAMTTVETMLLTLLYSLEYEVVRCKPNTMGRYFNLIVGNEQTSGLFIINQILKGESEHRCRILSSPRKYFGSLPKFDQNRLTNSLLLGLTYHYLHLSHLDEQSEESVDYSTKDYVTDAEPKNVVAGVDHEANIDNDVEPNTTVRVLRLGEKLKQMKEEALKKMSEPKQKKPLILKGTSNKKRNSSDKIIEEKTSKR